ncbi:MAG: hypothetical protein ABIP78_06575 [Pyrinomonadaceae bacterium]
MMLYLKRTILMAVCLVVLAGPFVVAQEKPSSLSPNQPISFTLFPGMGKAFSLQLKEDQIAQITWLANEELILRSGVLDLLGIPLEIGDSESLLFIAPKDGEYTLILKYDESSEIKDEQNITVEYALGFILPKRAKQKDFRKVNGYDIRIYTTPETGDDSGSSTVIFEKAGRKKKILKDFGSDYIGYSFSDTISLPAKPETKRRAALIKNTIDKTGDGVPDVMIDYFSGGAHCCFSTYFYNLGETIDLVEEIDTQHAGISAIGARPKGGLRFETNENNFAYWNTCFACSPTPRVILEFEKGILKPNFDSMKRPPPSLASLKIKAKAARQKINLDPYTDDGEQFEDAFCSEMLDLIYSGNESLAWQYFDLVWPSQKEGKQLFLTNFKDVLSNSYYGTKDANSQNGFRNYWKGFNKIIETLKK